MADEEKRHDLSKFRLNDDAGIRAAGKDPDRSLTVEEANEQIRKNKEEMLRQLAALGYGGSEGDEPVEEDEEDHHLG